MQITRTRHQTITGADRGDRPPLSHSQQGLWLLDQLHPGSTAYNVPFAVRLTGPLDHERLAAALTALVARHEALRTVFPVADGRPYQHVLPAGPIEVPVTECASQQQAYELVDAWTHEPFELAAEPLLRARVFRLDPDQHILALVMHHMVCDGPSVHVLFAELAEQYAGESQRPALTVQFADFAGWQRHRQGSAEQLDWWRERLAGAPTVLPLPADRPRPATRTTDGATHVFTLPAALLTRATALARRHRATPFMVMFSAYAALLGRLTGVKDLLIATPVNGRAFPQLEPLIGFFVNTLPVRVDLSGAPTFADLVDRVRDSVLAAMTHQDVPFEALVEGLRIERSLSHTPLVQTLFTFEPTVLAAPRLPGLDAELVTLRARGAKFDLDLMVVRASDGSGDFEVWINYSTDLFDAATIERLAGRFERLLTMAVSLPGLPLHDLPVLGDEELHTVTAQWAHGPAAAAGPSTPALFARQAAASPQAPALALDGAQLTYGELDARVQRLAEHLVALGVRPDDVVGVLLPRGFDLVTAVLAIQRAGGAYLPLDLAHPPAHRARVLAGAAAKLVVTDTAGTRRLTGLDTDVALVDRLPQAKGPVTLPDCDPQRLAYTIFTSGSTGEPKGVGVTHRGLANHARAIAARYRLAPTDRVLQFAGIGFDVAAEELFATLTSGGCVVLCADPPAPADLTALLLAGRVTVANLPAGYWQGWVGALGLPAGRPAWSLRLMVVGSESVDAATVATWQRHAGVPLLNAYGLTETTITSTVYDVDGPVPGLTVPIGRPLAGVSAYVLDERLSPVPAGVPGELYLAGAGLARGYLGRPDLTAERFIPHPFEPGARLHRTGDRARWRDDGVLEVLGRVDAQLKVRGFRIEPAEVEAALCTHPQVLQAAATARPGRDGHARLVAYVVPADGGEVPTDLRAHLAGRLPAHLVPTTLVGLAALPMTAGGKVDVRRLPEPPEPAGTAAMVAAGSDLEHAVAGIWAEVLGMPRVGVSDNFFDLGGTSLGLATVLRRLRELLDRPLAMVTLYEHPTIAALAAHLAAPASTAASGPTWAVLVPSRPDLDAATGAAPPAQGRSVRDRQRHQRLTHRRAANHPQR